MRLVLREPVGGAVRGKLNLALRIPEEVAQHRIRPQLVHFDASAIGVVGEGSGLAVSGAQDDRAVAWQTVVSYGSDGRRAESEICLAGVG